MNVKILAKLLNNYRNINSLTQSELVHELMEYSERFSGLNIVTLSRWENEVTKPGLKKKQALVKFLFSRGCFENSECRNMI